MGETYGWEPPKIKMVHKIGKLKLSDNASSFNYEPPTLLDMSSVSIVGAKCILTLPTGQSEEHIFRDKYYIYDNRYTDTEIELNLPINGEYKIYFEMLVSPRKGYLTIKRQTYIYVGAAEEQITSYKISNVLNRALNLTPPRKLNEQNKYKFDEAQLDEFSKEESPEFAFTGHTLFEAMLQIAGYKGAFPKLKGDVISFRPLWNGEWKTAKDLPEPIQEITSSDINQYCTYLETEVQNLVGLNDSKVGSVVEPYRGGYKTTRSGGGSEISQDTAMIPTDYNQYQHIKEEIGYINGEIPVNEDGSPNNDLTAYMYESGDYNALSDTSGAYPNSKAYALKWEQMGQNITELAHRINGPSELANAFKSPAIANIIQAKTGIGYDSGFVAYILKLLGIQDSDSFADLMFRTTYIPVINARIKQYKENFANFHNDGSIKYNQTAELVDSEMYGGHLKQLIRKIGNHVKQCIYIFERIDDVPKVGTVVDGYSVYEVQMSIRENEVVATVSYVKYAELSRFIGVKNAWKDSDVSIDKCYNRAISYNEFLLITADGDKKSTSNALSNAALNGLKNFTNAAPLTCVKATGKMNDGTPLNTVLLPVISLAMGNSVMFQWGYKNNYSAGYMSEKAPDGATNALSTTKYNRAQKAVKYCDMYGRMETYDFSIMPTGPVPDGDNICWFEGDDVITDAATVMRNIGYALPLMPDELGTVLKYNIGGEEYTAYERGWTGENFISVNDLLVEKNSSEALTFSVQLHYCTDNENFIIGSGLTNFCSLIGGAAEETAVYGFGERINIFNRRLPVDKATNLGNVSFEVDDALKRVKITLPPAINNYSAWAFMGRDKNGNWQIIFGENRDLKGTGFDTVLYLLPMHKLEDFV